MIKTILHFLKIHRKVIFGNPSVIVQDVFGKTPESLNAVDVVFGLLVHHVFRVIHLVMLPQTLQGIVASEPVRKVHRSLPSLLPNDLHELRSRDTLHNSRIDPSIALQKAEYNAFALGSASSFPLAPAAEVGLVHFNLSGQLAALKLSRMVDRFAEVLIYSGNGLVIKAEIMGKFVGRLNLIEAFEYGKLSAKLTKALLSFASATFYIASTCLACLKRTAENALSTLQKVGRTTENVLLPLCHMDNLTPYGYDSH